ncbi:MAG: hypothetical protein ACREC5_00865 [Thermoplasmata archaeon]
MSGLALRREGAVELELPESPGERGPARRRAIFYNAAMALDRDLNVSVLAGWRRVRGAPGRGWEMLSATGIRGLRLWAETDALGELRMTEGDPSAARVLEGNARRVIRPGAQAMRADARRRPEGAPFDYVDLDPFGSPAPFADIALAAVADGGLVAVTATDMPVLAGAQPEACARRYGARPLHGRSGPEGGLRILLADLARRAAGTGREIRPLLGYVLDHHVRSYVVVGPAGPVAPPVATLDRIPDGAARNSGRPPFGPMWLGALFDPEFLKELDVPPQAARGRELGRLLERFREESAVAIPFFFEANEIAHQEGLARPPPLTELLAELRRNGFPAARSHVRPGAFRTAAPAASVAAAARRVLDGARRVE